MFHAALGSPRYRLPVVHGLLCKINGTRKWRMTKKGHVVMSTLLKCHDVLYHEELMKIAA